eukprot:NODE_4145_length_605_cov_109.406475_g2982_i0.p3 GENE.NODE_4145_length_605_cov_109.406475_g2982_i0~~NODE_4145_length_605_cov_109.406475_g2982_i0.p3  ORF type:complete len:90 (+),score=46.88 NODE_4145_length_605_cov_109.406475_g2982_i0:25-270(+)
MGDRLVAAVDFDLHPTFTPSSVRVKQAPYTVSRLGWGSFEIAVTVHWQAQAAGGAGLPATSTYRHMLRFEDDETSATVAVA